MKALISIVLLTIAPSTVLGTACTADNVLRALRANSAKASPFCSTYSLPPSNQPLPTYVSQYPASRVSSGCSCLITATSSTSTTSTVIPATPSPTSPVGPVCEGELIRNGNFETVVNGKPEPWFFYPENHNYGWSSYANMNISGGNHYANLTIDNHGEYGNGGTYFKQDIPGLCLNTSYVLKFTSTFTNNGGPHYDCRATVDLGAPPGDSRMLVFLGGPVGADWAGDELPWQTKTRSHRWTNTWREEPTELVVHLNCGDPYATWTIDNISLVGLGKKS